MCPLYRIFYSALNSIHKGFDFPPHNDNLFICLSWGFTALSTIFQSWRALKRRRKGERKEEWDRLGKGSSEQKIFLPKANWAVPFEHVSSGIRPSGIRAVWSGPSLSANRIVGYYRMYEWSKGPDGTLRMRRMIWICTFCACSKARLFHLTPPSYGKANILNLTTEGLPLHKMTKSIWCQHFCNRTKWILFSSSDRALKGCTRD